MNNHTATCQYLYPDPKGLACNDDHPVDPAHEEAVRLVVRGHDLGEPAMIYDPDANVWVRPTVLGYNEPTTYLDDPDFGWELEPDRHRTLRELPGGDVPSRS